MNKLLYLAGDIMLFGSNLARKYEYKLFRNKLPKCFEIYSPISNKKINDKTSVSIEENNGLAERIVFEDCQRLRASDIVVINPEQHAIGTMVETGFLAGRKDLADELEALAREGDLEGVRAALDRVKRQRIYAHYYDLRDTNIPEAGFRRSFGMNQFLYGTILFLTNGRGFMKLEEIADEIEKGGDL